MSSLRSRHASLSGEERAYVVARVVLNLLFLTPFALGYADYVTLSQQSLFVVSTVAFTLGTAVMAVAVHRYRVTLGSVLLWLLPTDTVVFAVATYLNRGEGDAVYPVIVVTAVFYALIVPRREALVAATVLGAGYVAAYATPEQWAGYLPLMLGIKFITVIIVGWVVSTSVSRQRQRELEVEAAVADRESLNFQLTRRLIELQAVAEITDVIHASLDADVVGPKVVEILAKVLGVESCSLFVVQKETGDTVFEAGFGTVGPISAFAVPNVGEDDSPRRFVPSLADSPFSCLAVHDHDDVTVVFCAEAHDMEMLTDEDRLVLGAVGAELVVAIENSQLYQLTRRLAVTDELTGLHNRRFLNERLADESLRARRYGGSLSLLMLDCDDFKAYNDRFGHLSGDDALIELADVLREAVRDVDVVARYGGEEFCILLPATDEAGAFVVAEKVREAVAAHGFGPTKETLTVSVGIATLPNHAIDEEGLQRAADGALYAAKDGGKNRVRVPVRASAEAPAEGEAS